MTAHRVAGLLLLALLVSCTMPHTKGAPVPRGTVTLQLSPPIRTVGVDWSSLVKTYEVTLTKEGEGTVLTGTTSEGQTSLTIAGISVGYWDILVEGKAGGGTVAQAALAHQSLPSSTPIAIKVKPLTGIGGFSFKLRFLQPMEPADQITAVQGQLSTLAGAPFGAPFLFATEDFVPEAGYQAVTLGRSGLDAGAYRLGISLQRGGLPARYLSEAINIAGGVTADRWISPEGTVLASRDLTLADFTSTNTALGTWPWRPTASRWPPMARPTCSTTQPPPTTSRPIPPPAPSR